MLFNHYILCCPLLLLPSIFPSTSIFSNESVLCTRWPKYWLGLRFRLWLFSKLTGCWWNLVSCTYRVYGSLLLQHHWEKVSELRESLVQFISVTQSCPTFYDPLDCSTPGFPIHHQLTELAQTHVLRVSDAFPCLQFFPASRSFPIGQFFASGGQSIGVSASASVLPMSIQDWFPLGWTGCISLQSKRLSGVFSNTIAQKYQFFSPLLSL